MNYETKRNVFEGVVETLNVMDGAPDDYCKELIDNYDEALPDNLPVIPEAIGEYITSCKARMMDLHDSMFNWLRSEEEDEFMDCHSEIFARAWLLGVWCIEETGEIVKLEAEK